MELLTRSTLIQRIVALLRPKVDDFRAGAEFSPAFAAHPDFSIDTSMSAVAGVAWVYAVASARIEDMAGLPKKARRGRGERSEVVDDHPYLDLIESPNTGEIGELFRRQRYLDFMLTGTAYAVALSDGSGLPASLVRLHPKKAKPIVGAQGWPIAIEYNGGNGVQRFDLDIVQHLRNASWQDTPSGLHGIGRIQPLFHTLTAEVAAQKRAAETAKTGRPAVIIRPKDDRLPFVEEIVRKIRTLWQEATRKEGGAIILPGPAEIEKLDWSPRELEMAGLFAMNKEQILAVFGVPAVRIGGETANLALAHEQLRMYWRGLQADARLIDSADTKIARLFPGSEDIRIETDFSGVPWLQEDRTERLQRVKLWIELGVDPDEAAVLEGFDGVSFLPAQEEEVEQGPEPEEPREGPSDAEEDIRSLVRAVNDRLNHGETVGSDTRPTPGGWQRAALLASIPQTAEEKDEVWGMFIRQVHSPIEARFHRLMVRFFQDQAERMAGRVSSALREQRSVAGSLVSISRATDEVIIAEIVQAARETSLLQSVLLPILRRSIEAGFDTFAEVVDGIVYDPIEDAEVRMASSVASTITETTAVQIRNVVQLGLQEGQSVVEMQAAIQRMPAFSPMRALRVARTETTNAVIRGQLIAQAQAAEVGITVDKIWLTARDEAVRESHIELDGEQVRHGDSFVFSAGPNVGAPTEGPGQSGIAGEDINCRCTLIPKVR